MLATVKRVAIATPHFSERRVMKTRAKQRHRRDRGDERVVEPEEGVAEGVFVRVAEVGVDRVAGGEERHLQQRLQQPGGRVVVAALADEVRFQRQRGVFLVQSPSRTNPPPPPAVSGSYPVSGWVVKANRPKAMTKTSTPARTCLGSLER